MKTLLDLTPEERRVLAEKVDANPLYLWQCGKGMRTPSLLFADKLIKADKRLSFKSLVAPCLAAKAKNLPAEQSALPAE